MAKENEKIVPKCMQMCPSSECSFRERQGLIHILESDSLDVGKKRRADRNKMIKTYCRSAAGQTLTKSELLRSPAVLKDTVNYIFEKVIHDKRVSDAVMYDFINDRLRSVKQDGVIQRLQAKDWFQILPPMIRFYAFSAYWLCEESAKNFDQKLNRNQLVDCLLHFITNYERNTHEDYADVYAEVEALYLIINFDMETINRAILLDLPQTDFQNTLNLILKLYEKNYVAVFRKLLILPLLPACLFTALHMNKLRKDVLRVMSYAYSSKNVNYRLSKLKCDLLYNTLNEVTVECKFYGIATSAEMDSIYFQKMNFKDETAPTKKIKVLDEKLSITSLSNLITST